MEMFSTDFLSIIKDPWFQVMIKAFFYSSPAWGTILLWEIFVHFWLRYKREQFFASQSYTLIEIKMPKEIFKSPKSMEFLFNSLYQTGGEGGFKLKWKEAFKDDDDKFHIKLEKLITSDTYLKGQTRPWFSFEICVIEGKVRFFIWTRSNLKNLVEAQLYSQYPGIEVFEVPDYSIPFCYDKEKHSMWATEFELTKDDPYPIKTYIDYGMDKDPKEEYKIDPLTPLIEFLASVGKDHNIWIQIIARAHINEDTDPITGKAIDLKWLKKAEEEIKKIQEKAKPPKDDKGVQPPHRPLTDGETETIKSLERSITKPGFDVGIRAIYWSEKDKFNKANGAGVVSNFRHFNSNLNGFKGTRSPDKNPDKESMLFAYKSRGYFYNQFTKDRKSFVLNTEELATIFHLPSKASTETPSFERIESKKAQAPGNLPI
jgi:hypothetical protein